MLTVTGEGYRLLGFRDFNRNLDRAAIVTSTVSLGDDRTENVAGVGRHVAVREFGTQTGRIITTETKNYFSYLKTHLGQPGTASTSLAYGFDYLDESIA